MFSGDGDQTGIAYTVGTVGHADKSVTAGLGYAYTDDDSGGPVGMIGGERRLRHNLKLISENYLWRSGGILSGGVRFIGDRFSTDVALVAPVGSDILVVFPVANLVYVF